MAIANKQLVRQFEKTIVEFAANEDGCFFALTHDTNFVKMFRQTLNKELVIGSNNIVTLSDETKLLKELKSPMYKGRKILLCVERILHNKSSLAFVKNLMAVYDDIYVVVLTSEVERQVLILLHEIGVSNFITKPVSMNTLVEKLAFTLKPQGKIGQFIDKAKEYLGKGMYDEAVNLANKILEIKPGSAAALMVKGDAFKAKGQIDDARIAYEKAHKGATLYLEPLKKLAELFQDEGNLEEQLTYLKKLDRLSPLNVERKVSMGEIHMAFDEKEKAGECFDAAVKNARKEAQDMIEDVKRSIAEKCLDAAPDMAEKFYRSILDDKEGGLQRADIETFNRLGMALRRQGRWEDAVQEYDQALKVSPEDENVIFNKAVAFTEGGRHREAVRELEKALALNPQLCSQSSVLCFNVGVMYANANNKDRAVEFMKKTIELDKTHAGARKMLKSL